jgi:hypothetical protein
VKEKRISMTLRQTFLCVVLGVLVSVASLFVYHKYYAPKIVAVDLNAYVTEQRVLFLKGEIGEEELKDNFDRLERVISSLPKGTVALRGDVVLGKATIITP